MSKKKADKLETIIIRTTVTIVTLLCILLGTGMIEKACWKAVATGTNLMILNYEVRSYNEQLYKTDAMTDKYNEITEKRNTFYQSEDTVIRVFSNLPTIPKLGVWLLSMFFLMIVPVAAILGIIKEINIERHFWKKEKKRWEQQDIIEKRGQEKSAKEHGKLAGETVAKLLQLGSSRKWK